MGINVSKVLSAEESCNEGRDVIYEELKHNNWVRRRSDDHIPIPILGWTLQRREGMTIGNLRFYYQGKGLNVKIIISRFVLFLFNYYHVLNV